MTILGSLGDWPADLVGRRFTATAPEGLLVGNDYFNRTVCGWVYAAFVIDVFARGVVGGQLSTRLHTDIALDALETGTCARRRAGRDLSQLIHYSERGLQYRTFRCTGPLAESPLNPGRFSCLGRVRGRRLQHHPRAGDQLSVQSRTDPQQRTPGGVSITLKLRQPFSPTRLLRGAKIFAASSDDYFSPKDDLDIFDAIASQSGWVATATGLARFRLRRLMARSAPPASLLSADRLVTRSPFGRART